MPITLSLSYPKVSNPFVEYVWDVDFATGGASDLAFIYAPSSTPLSLYDRGGWGDAPRYWSVSFDIPVEWSEIEGQSVASLLTDGATVLGFYGGANRLLMSDFSEHVAGGSYDDWIEGRGGDDWLKGDWGADTISGGAGNDILEGGYGRDTFVFAHIGPEDADRVVDFTGADRGALDIETFAKLKKVGPLQKKFFDSGNKHADDKNDYIVYHTKAGDLYYDRDGSGHRKAVLIAEFDGAPKLKAVDFDVI